MWSYCDAFKKFEYQSWFLYNGTRLLITDMMKFNVLKGKISTGRMRAGFYVLIPRVLILESTNEELYQLF